MIPDFLIEVDEVTLQMEDNWLEVKLRANYEVGVVMVSLSIAAL